MLPRRLFSRKGFPGSIKSSRQAPTEGEADSRQASGLQQAAADVAVIEIDVLTLSEGDAPEQVRIAVSTAPPPPPPLPSHPPLTLLSRPRG